MSSDETIPTLLHLAYHRFTRSLCLEQIKRTPLPADSPSFIFGSAYFESFENHILDTLDKLIMPKMCRDEASQLVQAIVDDMKYDLQNLNVTSLIGHIAKSDKWSDFVLPWYSGCWWQAGEAVFLSMFEEIMDVSEREGIYTVPEEDLAVYLDIWHDAPEDWKLNAFANLSRAFTRKTKYPLPVRDLFGLPRDLRFLTMLFGDFDLQTRLELWTQNWLDIAYGVLPMYLAPLMRMCCDSYRSYVEFKGAWLSRPEIIEKYYCKLMLSYHFTELDKLLHLYSSEDSKVLDLAVLTIRTFFIANPLPESYDRLRELTRTDGWIREALGMPELEYLWRVDEHKLKYHYFRLLQNSKYYQMEDFLTVFAPKEESLRLEKRFLESFLNNITTYDEPSCVWLGSDMLEKPIEFDEFLERVLGSTDEATAFKKRIIYAPSTLEFLRERNFFNSSHQISKFEELLKAYLLSEEEIVEWEDMFMRDIIKCLRKGYRAEEISQYSPSGLVKWCMSSEEKQAKFKSMITIDELFECLAKCNSSRKISSPDILFEEYMALEIALKKLLPDLEDRIEFKLGKLREYEINEYVLGTLLMKRRNQVFPSDDGTDEEWRSIVAMSTNFDLPE